MLRLPSKKTRAYIVRHISKRAATSESRGGGGAGIGNVQHQLFPTDDSSLFRHVAQPRTVSVIGAPMTYGQPFVGTDRGPELLRESGLLKDLSSLGWRVEDLPDLDFDTICAEAAKSSNAVPMSPNAKHSLQVGEGCRVLADLVESKLRLGRFPLILGGDHSIGIGSLAGILRAKPDTGVIWVDAHADLNVPSVSESGNMHGMPLGLMMKELIPDRSIIPGLEWMEHESKDGSEPPRLPPDSLVYVGLRDIDQAERRFIKQLGIKAFTMFDIDHLGIGRVMDLAFEHLTKSNPDRPLHLSYDIDAVDPAHAPATGTAVRGGLTWREAHFVAEYVVKTGSLASAEIVEVNHTLSDGDGANETVELGHNLVNAFLGESIL
ncbi:hypothetical protein ACHAWT_005313 [Skeletonema menzelii]|mmetsp:Transcript_19621/g.32143  ORF Transcript_19621/g.32143 Transcript_19621/m.32143 type:complete len:378 (+) Transcript_19621:51-1184(+)|eukprot:scaffold26679_cov171-Skeletonema_menzelii.AAC.7